MSKKKIETYQESYKRRINERIEFYEATKSFDLVGFFEETERYIDKLTEQADVDKSFIHQYQLEIKELTEQRNKANEILSMMLSELPKTMGDVDFNLILSDIKRVKEYLS